MVRKKYMPMGARLLVEDIITSLSIEERAAKSGLIAVVESENRPRATMGRVVAIGTDPIFTEVGVKVGDIVHFGHHAGTEHTIEDHPFRSLDWQEVTLLEQEVTESELPAC